MPLNPVARSARSFATRCSSLHHGLTRELNARARPRRRDSRSPRARHAGRVRALRRIEREQVLSRRRHREHHRELQRPQVLEQPPPSVPRPDRRVLGAPARAAATNPAGIGRPQPGSDARSVVPRLELAMPRSDLAHASPAVSAASAAARPCGVNPLRGFPALRSVTPQRRPAKARLRRQATLTGSVGRRAQASTSSSAGADAKGRTLLPQHPRPRLAQGRTRRVVVDDTRPAIDPDDVTDHAASSSSSSAAATSRMTIAATVNAVAAARCSRPPQALRARSGTRRAPRSRAPSDQPISGGHLLHSAYEGHRTRLRHRPD